MAVYAIDNSNRTVRVFNTLTEAVNGATAGEVAFYERAQPAETGTSEILPRATVARIRHDDRPGNPDTVIEATANSAELIVDPARPAPEADPLAHFAAHLAGHIRTVLESLRQAAARRDAYRQEADRERTEAGNVEAKAEEVKLRYRKLVAEARGKLRNAKGNMDAAKLRREIADLAIRELEELEPLQRVQGGPGPAALRAIAAERELHGLTVKLREAVEHGVECSKAVEARIAALESADATALDPRTHRRSHKAKSNGGRMPGETRGRRSAREGKTFRFRSDVKRNPAVRGSRRYNSYQIILDRPGLTYEAYCSLGGHPGDLGLALASGKLVMTDKV